MTVAILHPLTAAETATICRTLAARQLPVVVETDVFDTVHIWAGRPFSVPEEIAALRPFILATDAPKQWHGVKP